MSGVLIAEAAVVETRRILLAELPSELAAIEAERADGVALDRPAAVDMVLYPVDPASMEAGFMFEVLCDAAREMLPAEITATEERLASDCDVLVRFTLKDHRNEGPEKLALRAYRTAAGIVRVCCMRFFDFGGAVELCRFSKMLFRNVPGDVLVRQGGVRLAVRVRERLT